MLWGTFPTCLWGCRHVGNVPDVRLIVSEPRVLDKLSCAGPVPAPFFHGVRHSPPEKGDRHRRSREITVKNRISTEPVPVFGLLHLQFEL